MDTVMAAKNGDRGPAYRGMLAVVIILGVLIVIGLGALVVGIALRFEGHGRAREQISFFVPPKGARILGLETSGDRLILHLRTPSGDEVDVVDTGSGRLVAHFEFSSVP